jgi:SAM-dependent methyltransferase
VGAGFGRLADLYRGYEQVILLDYSRSLLREARERLGDDGFVYVAANLYDLPLADASVDTVVTVRVLHHVLDLEAAFRQFARVLRPGGIYTLEYANKRHLKAILRYLLGRQTESPFTLQPYEFAELNFDFHPDYVTGHLRKAGFVVEGRRAVSSFRAAFLKRYLPLRFLVAADALLQRPTAPLELAPSIFVRARVDKAGARRLNEALWRCLRCDATGLIETPEGLECPSCQACWPVEEGIYNFKTRV